jgi:hypothetical protein
MKERFFLYVSTVSHHSHDYVALAAPLLVDGKYVYLAIASAVFVVTILLWVEPVAGARKGHGHHASHAS